MIELADLKGGTTFTPENGYTLILVFASGEPNCMIPELAEAVRYSHPLSQVHHTADGLHTFRLGGGGILCWENGGPVANFHNQMVPVGGIYVACERGTENTGRHAASNVRERLGLTRELPTER